MAADLEQKFLREQRQVLLGQLQGLVLREDLLCWSLDQSALLREPDELRHLLVLDLRAVGGDLGQPILQAGLQPAVLRGRARRNLLHTSGAFSLSLQHADKRLVHARG